MKPFTFLYTVLIVCLFALGCKKDAHKTNPELTGCPTGTTCEALFTEQADANENGTLKAGNQRVFWWRQSKPPATSTLFIKAPLSGDSFSLDADDIKAGLVKWNFNCASCDYIWMMPVGGFVKGTNLTPEKTHDRTKWLIEAKVILEPVLFANAKIKDSVYVKQYFYPNFIYN